MLIADEQSQPMSKVISQQCLMKDLTTGVAFMPMFVSNNSKLLESISTFDRRSNITKQQHFSEALKCY